MQGFILSLISLFIAIGALVPVHGQTTREIIMRAMKDELARNMERLKLENLERPFFISYTISDARTMEVTATLGAVVQSSENHIRNHNVRVMVGDYSRNDENFRDISGGFRSTMLGASARIPLEDDYDGIRRALWIATDNVYKRASEQYERKIAALEQQSLSAEEAELEDFSRAPVVEYTAPPRTFKMNQNEWEEIAKELSGSFLDYPDIHSSQVRIYFFQGDLFFMNSEGSKVVQPLTLAAVQVNAATQAVDGKPVTNHQLYYAAQPDELPPLNSVKRGVRHMAEELAALRTAPVFEDSYTGPIMFEGQAVMEFFAQRFFSGSGGLLAFRRPTFSDPRISAFMGRSQGQPLDDNIGRRIVSRDLTIKATPRLKNYSGQKLIGSFHVDTEGVQPPDEIVLVENGLLKTLLNNRTPTPKVKESNGHQRPVMGSSAITTRLGPGVISVSTSKGMSESEMKDELLQLAKDEGLEYGIVVRKLTASVSGAEARLDPFAFLSMGQGGQQGASLTKPVLVYKVYVEDGREELVRSVKLGSLSISSLRRMAGASEKRVVYNTLVSGGASSSGFLAFMAPTSRKGSPGFVYCAAGLDSERAGSQKG